MSVKAESHRATSREMVCTTRINAECVKTTWRSTAVVYFYKPTPRSPANRLQHKTHSGTGVYVAQVCRWLRCMWHRCVHTVWSRLVKICIAVKVVVFFIAVSMALNLNSMYITTDEKLDVNQGLSLPCNIINSAYNRTSTSHSSDGLFHLQMCF